ncbi:MAG: tetraacyldisaccharide 4'-kinase, partial [Synergistaceae bacterium]|nr:tetraacyldisaccharide 4'-kinase [Synergistaceae bacterium]
IDGGKIFTSEMNHDGWILFNGTNEPEKNSRVFAFSAIGSPESFVKTLKELGLDVAGSVTFRDHHNYSQKDLESLYRAAKKANADYMSCTEKDLYNLPSELGVRSEELGVEWKFDIPLIVPKVKAAVNEREQFFETLAKTLQPKIVIASNGYGEDAIGVILAKKFRTRLPDAKIFAFPLVGRGDAYTKENFEIKAALSVTPSGGVLKYSVKDLWGDMRAGLLKQVKAQLRDWKKLAGKIKTPVCVGDVYLLLHTLWGTGARPMFAATAKTVYLSGHWRLERVLINKFTLRTWTRDAKSAEQLGKNSIYAGSPVMDLLHEDEKNFYERGDVVLLLPGSRSRANKDVKLLLDAAEIMHSSGETNFRMILAPTLEFDKFFAACEAYGWQYTHNTLVKNNVEISISFESVAKSVSGVKILLGLGGTANQLCAGLGIPVISIDEKGKRVQKKLLGDSEILVEATASALASCALKVLADKKTYDLMSSAGRERMGSPGALDDIVKFACETLGWETKEKIFNLVRGEE